MQENESQRQRQATDQTDGQGKRMAESQGKQGRSSLPTEQLTTALSLSLSICFQLHTRVYVWGPLILCATISSSTQAAAAEAYMFKLSKPRKKVHAQLAKKQKKQTEKRCMRT